MNNLGWLLFIGLLVYVIYKSSKREVVDLPTISPSTPKDNDIKCELKDTYGNIVTITGKAGDTQFEKMCTQSVANQPVYVYGYPYSFVRFHGGGGHRGGHGGHGGGGHH